MAHYSEFETDLQLSFPEHELIIRNMAEEGNTPVYRPHPARGHLEHYAFPGGKELVSPILQRPTAGGGFHPTPDEWLTETKADLILSCFGSNEHFQGKEGLQGFIKEYDGLIQHTLKQQYNGSSAPTLVLVTPPCFEDRSDNPYLTDGSEENASLSLYAEATVKLAQKHGLPVIDLFSKTLEATKKSKSPLTTDGFHYTRAGNKLLGELIIESLFLGEGQKVSRDHALRKKVHAAVVEKNWVWHNYFKIPNAIHAEGIRHERNGHNYPPELLKLEKMVPIRDQSIFSALKGKPFDLKKADETTGELPEVKTTYNSKDRKSGNINYQPGAESLNTFSLPEGYEIGLFADEQRFPNLANPVQMAFDGKGRLWVAVIPSYPHWCPGDPKPNDKLLIYEDTDNDGIADKETTFKDQLHLITGFEVSKNRKGQLQVHCAQKNSLFLFTDTDGDSQADETEILMSGFDDYDTHHQISSFYSDPGGGILMGEGLFLLSTVETRQGVIRGTNGGFFRYDPMHATLQRIAQPNAFNPWGIVMDDYGQTFHLNTSTPNVCWTDGVMQKPIFGSNLPAPTILTSNSVRPTSGLEIISTSHFPEEVQGDLILCNTIGFRGAKQHALIQEKDGFTSKFRHDLFYSDDPNVRPVDLEVAPDGSLYFLDWQNTLIGHAQFSARDPHRDHQHGRIYRITYPSRPLVEPAEIDGADIDTLLSNLTLPEARTRYRTRKELRSRNAEDVLPKLKTWISQQSDPRLRLEGLWVSWSINRLDKPLLKELLKSENHRIRAAAVNVIARNLPVLPEARDLITAAAKDEDAHVRLMALNAATLLEPADLKPIQAIIKEQKAEKNTHNGLIVSQALIDGGRPRFKDKIDFPKHLNNPEKVRFERGYHLYNEEGNCGTCHQPNGKGLTAAGFPPLKGSEWVTGDRETLAKIALHGIMGPLKVKGKDYNGAMVGFANILEDEEMADVLFYIQNEWGNKAKDGMRGEHIKSYRAQFKDRKTPWTAEELQK